MGFERWGIVISWRNLSSGQKALLYLLGVFLFSMVMLAAYLRSRDDAHRVSPTPSNNSTMSSSNDAGRPWERQPMSYTGDTLGINFPWLDLHTGADFKQAYNWLTGSYDSSLVEGDLTEIESMGIRKMRSFCVMESVFDFRDGAFRLNPTTAKNLDDFLDRAERHGIRVITVMGDGNYDSKGATLDGKFRWNLIQSQEGRRVYADAYVAYLKRFGRHRNILMWEMHNQPYGELTWSPAARDAGITQEQLHDYLWLSYTRLKSVAGAVPVGFSDMEEKEQGKYHLFANDVKRRALIDDCTDIYSMHIYRASPDEIEDFRTLVGKPKWAVELGSYNFSDPDASEHPFAASNELYDGQKNYEAVRHVGQKLMNSGFTLIMPWGFSGNPGLVTHNKDGSHTLGPLALYMKKELTGTNAAAK
jgi:hypothetical protein